MPTEPTALVPHDRAEIQLGALQASTPGQLVKSATLAANELASVIDSRKLFTLIRGRKHVRVEGWLTLATMMGTLPYEVSNDPDEHGVYVAVVELRRMADGAVLSRASAECGSPDELDKWGKPLWASRAAYARRSMASTRATSKACRIAFSWVIALAGYATTPAEEMEDVALQDCDPEPRRPPQRQADTRPSTTISTAQRKRMWAIATAAGVSEADVREIVGAEGYESTADIPRAGAYDNVIKAIEEHGASAQANDDATAGEDAEPAEVVMMPDDDIPFPAADEKPF